MITTSHYCDVMIKMPEVSREIHARIITIVHAVIASGHKLGLSWPDWKTTPGEFGYLCRIFGDEKGLNVFNTSLAPLLKMDLVRTFPISVTPEVSERFIFLRDRRIDKFSPSSVNRLKRRASERGEVYVVKERFTPKRHSLRLQSGSTGNEFYLFVRREQINTNRSGGHEYGLGFSLPNF